MVKRREHARPCPPRSAALLAETAAPPSVAAGPDAPGGHGPGWQPSPAVPTPSWSAARAFPGPVGSAARGPMEECWSGPQRPGALLADVPVARALVGLLFFPVRTLLGQF